MNKLQANSGVCRPESESAITQTTELTSRFQIDVTVRVEGNLTEIAIVGAPVFISATLVAQKPDVSPLRIEGSGTVTFKADPIAIAIIGASVFIPATLIVLRKRHLL